MRQVLVDYAKKQSATKRGNGAEQFTVGEPKDQTSERSSELMMLDRALTKLAGIDERKATIIECHFFIGLTLPEVAELLGVSQATVERDWRFARSWLKREITGELKQTPDQ
jgi:RNA polymerase sigma factor (TIGR02999 family)